MTGITRRTFLLLTGGAGAAASFEPGRKLVNKLIPYVNQPEYIVPGDVTWFATTCRECPAGCGMLIAHRDGRVTKAEGNPAHPVSHGGLCPRGQSSLQGLYDPDRLKKPLRRTGTPAEISWEVALKTFGQRLRERKGRLVIVSRPETGAVHELLAAFATTFGGRLLYHDRLAPQNLLAAHEGVYGGRFIPRYDMSRTDLLVSFGADFLETWVSPVRFSEEFSNGRSRPDQPLRHIFIGPRLSMTAGNADRYVSVRPEDRIAVAGAVLAAVLADARVRNTLTPVVRERVARYRLPGYLPKDLAREIAGALLAARQPLVLPGAALPDSETEAELATLVTLLNLSLGNPAVDVTRREESWPSHSASDIVTGLRGLTPRDTVLILDTNIAFTLPGTADLLGMAGLVVYAGTLPDETADAAHLVLPLDYPLEMWGDHEPTTGIHSLLQPVVNRMYESRSAGDLLLEAAAAAGTPLKRKGITSGNFEEWLKSRWRELQAEAAVSGPFDTFWNDSLANGFATSAARIPAPAPRPDAAVGILRGGASAGTGLSVYPFSSITLYDGRTANRGWIQEAPDPVTTVAWGSWGELNPATAGLLGIKNGDEVEVSTRGATIRLPVVVTDMVHEGTLALLAGQGHAAKGMKVAAGVGANVFAFSGSTGPVTLRKTGKGDLVRASGSDRQHGRKILQWLSAKVLHRLRPGDGEHVKLPLKESYERNKDTWAGHDHNGHRWGMVVDLNRCTGCQACTISCYAENNIAVVGKKGVANGRELAWLKVVPYRDEEGKKVGWLPILCQHCDAAPCEPVCPVYAAVHNEEGLNAQVYNRCIGTRYCANNCPYKVRRFNWFDPKWRYPLDLQLNPDVTVRSRGVMEKCTFCVQRIRSVELKAAREGRPVRDGEVQPACAQSCPTRAIIFGDLMDPESRVLKLMKEDPRRYQLLEKLNTKPAVMYLKRVVNDPPAKGERGESP